jgi:hypothetical protein
MLPSGRSTVIRSCGKPNSSANWKVYRNYSPCSCHICSIQRSHRYSPIHIRWFQSWVQSPGLKVKFLFHDSLSASIMILADCIAREGWREYRIRLCQSKYWKPILLLHEMILSRLLSPKDQVYDGQHDHRTHDSYQ